MRLLLPLLFALALSTLVLAGFFGAETLPDVHDPTLAYRTQITLNTIADGQFPPAWNNTLNYGFGYPLNLYYAPLLPLLTAFFSFVTQNVVVGIKVTLWLVTLVGIGGTYFFLKRYSLTSALVGSTAFAFLPYHASALYVRGSYAEYLAVNLLPWVLYFWTKPLTLPRHLSFAALSLCLLFLSHNTVPFVVLPILLFSLFWQRPKSFKSLLLGTSLALALAAFFLAPVLFERGFVQVDRLATQTVLTDHFVTAAQLWYSPWGYGGSAVGEGDLMSFMLGKGQLILGALGLGLALWRRDRSFLILLTPLLLTTLLTLSLSRPFWAAIPPLALLQFPWRLLGVSTFALALFAGYLFRAPARWPQYLLAGFACLALVVTNYSYFKPWNLHTFNADILTSPANLHPLVQNKIPEYLPTWMPNFPSAAKSDGLTRTATQVTGQLTHPSLAPLTIQTAYMPHWRLTLNTYPADIIPAQDGTIQTHAVVPPGNYLVNLTWEPTVVEKIGIGLSLVALVVVLGLAL